jgi:uncharacterized protein (TIGR02145 family)
MIYLKRIKISVALIILFFPGSSNLIAQSNNIYKHIVFFSGDTISYPVDWVDHVYYDTLESICPDTLHDVRDGEIYAVVQIDDKCWMANNLRYDVPGVYTSGPVVDTINSANPSSLYGRMYDWNTLMNGDSSSSDIPSGIQGICPNGWHLPSDMEWSYMETKLGMPMADFGSDEFRGEHGTVMKSTTGWNLNTNGSNASGFNIFPAGDYESGIFNALGEDAVFWSSTKYSGTFSWFRLLNFSVSGVYRNYGTRTSGASCRCVRD